MKHPEDMLHRTPEEAARRICLGLLEEAEAAVARLDDKDDLEALHDFRVAIRRLRATSRAYRKDLAGAIDKKDRRALRTLQQATGAGRDAEVALAWLLPQRSAFRAPERLGFDAVVDQLAQQKGRGYRRARKEVRRDFKKMQKHLYPRLECMKVKVHLCDAPAPAVWADEVAKQARLHVAEIAHLLGLDHPKGEPPEEGIHDARIAMKRLRYLMEPVRAYVPAARALMKGCKGLQDTLGDLNDCAVLEERLEGIIEATTKERARRLHDLALTEDEERIRAEVQRTERPGLDEIRRRIGDRREALMAQLRADWLDSGFAEFQVAVHAVADRLEALADRDIEVERKYLLRALPEAVRSTKAARIEQGWLPGDRLRERLRRIDGPKGTKFVRTVKVGQGIERFELEEETSPELFGALWPLTEGCRVEKRRYDMPDGDLVWEIDEFTDRELFLAEVELPSRDVQPEPPAWLRDLIVEEVTGDPAYVNLNLAR